MTKEESYAQDDKARGLLRRGDGIARAASDKQLDAPARQRLRQEQAPPILEKLQEYLQEQRAAALPKSPLGAAIGYALRNWVALTRYSGDSRLKIDNNGTEQALRPIVQINPFVYLRDVIERVSTHPARLVLELTPCEWKRLHLDSGAHAAA